MQPLQSDTDIFNAFKLYKETVLQTDVDIHFWQWFIKEGVKGFMQDQSKGELVYAAIFAAYNINHVNSQGILKSNEKSIQLLKSNLENHRVDFLSWVINLSIVKIYNAVEIFFYQAIQLKYFPNNDSPLNNKKAIYKINKEIKTILQASNIKYDTTNNKHLIEFIKSKSSEYSFFINNPIRIDLITTWVNFFELLSILRNIVVHDSMLVTKNVENRIKGHAKDIFNRHFNIVKNISGNNVLQPKEDQYKSFVVIVNDFTLNTVKFLSNEQDFDFIQMY